MQFKTLLQLSSSMLLLGSLAACGDDNNDMTPTPTPTPPGEQTFQEMFGAKFAQIFNADETAEPVDPSPGDVPDLAPASDPIMKPSDG